MARAKRGRKTKGANVRLPRGRELKRLESLCALGRAHARAKKAGALDLGAREPKPGPPRQLSGDQEDRKLEQRLELMVELEVRWRLMELGVPHTDEMIDRFEHFRFDSDHRRKLEAVQRQDEYEKMRAQSAKERIEKAQPLPGPLTVDGGCERNE